MLAKERMLAYVIYVYNDYIAENMVEKIVRQLPPEEFLVPALRQQIGLVWNGLYRGQPDDPSIEVEVDWLEKITFVEMSTAQ